MIVGRENADPPSVHLAALRHCLCHQCRHPFLLLTPSIRVGQVPFEILFKMHKHTKLSSSLPAFLIRGGDRQQLLLDSRYPRKRRAKLISPPKRAAVLHQRRRWEVIMLVALRLLPSLVHIVRVSAVTDAERWHLMAPHPDQSRKSIECNKSKDCNTKDLLFVCYCHNTCYNTLTFIATSRRLSLS